MTKHTYFKPIQSDSSYKHFYHLERADPAPNYSETESIPEKCAKTKKRSLPTKNPQKTLSPESKPTTPQNKAKEIYSAPSPTSSLKDNSPPLQSIPRFI